MLELLGISCECDDLPTYLFEVDNEEGAQIPIEEVVRRRLLIDGDGMGDDRKINSLVKSYVQMVDSEDSEENDVEALKRFITQVRQMEYVARRTIAAIKTNEESKQLYVNLKTQVQSEIEQTRDHIEKSKKLLEEATKHRKYSMEYDALAKLIESKPDRKMTEIKRMGLALELDVLQKRQANVNEQLNYRKQTVSLMSGSLEVVKQLVKSSDEKQSRHRKSSKKSKKQKHRDSPAGPVVTPMDVDSTSQSEPPSPMEQSQPSSQSQSLPQSQSQPLPQSLSICTPTEAVNGAGTPIPTVVANSSSETSSTLTPTRTGDTDKAKSEKYEDLSESEDSQSQSPYLYDRLKHRHGSRFDPH